MIVSIRYPVVVPVHASLDPSAGDYTRVRRVRQVLLTLGAVTIVEVVVVKLSQIPHWRRWRTQYGPASHQRLFVPLVLPMVEIYAVRWVNHVVFTLAGCLLKALIRPDVIVCETLKPWAMARSLRYADSALVVDLHGAASEEVGAASGTWDPKKWTPERIRRYVCYIERMESQALMSAHALVLASHALENHVRAKHALPAVQRRCVYASAVDTDRFIPNADARHEIRRHMEVNDTDVVLVYSGSLYAWQCIQEMLDLYRRVVMSCDACVHLLVLTSGDGAVIERCMNQMDLSRQRVHIHAVAYEQMPYWLCSADIGIALRKDTVVNRVASPTKVGEYLACGLPVITTPVGIGWCDWSRHTDAVCFIELDHMDRSAHEVNLLIERYCAEPNRFQDAARACALDQWSEPTAGGRLSDFFTQVLKRG